MPKPSASSDQTDLPRLCFDLKFKIAAFSTVAIDGAENAGILAVQMLSLKYPELRQAMKDYKAKMEREVMAIDAEFQK